MQCSARWSPEVRQGLNGLVGFDVAEHVQGSKTVRWFDWKGIAKLQGMKPLRLRGGWHAVQCKMQSPEGQSGVKALAACAHVQGHQ